MAKKVEVKGFEEFKRSVEEHFPAKEVNAYFTGAKKDGASWCPDCVRAEPHVMEAVAKFAKAESVFIIVDVGDVTFWKDINNPFRKDKDVHIQVIPSLIRYKSYQRLEGDQCEKSELLKMFFTDQPSD